MLKYIFLLLIVPAIALADDVKSGATYYHKDGTWTQEVRPGVYRSSDGTIYQSDGKGRHNDTKGGTTIQRGGTIVQRDGSITQQDGNRYYNSKGGDSYRQGNTMSGTPKTFGWSGGTYIKKK